MKIPKLAFAMGYIDDDLIIAAEEYKPISQKKSVFHWKRIAAIAACFCVIVCSLFLYQNSRPADMTDLHEIVQGGVNAEVIQVSGFTPFNNVKIEESQLLRTFYTSDMLSLYTIVGNSVFDDETIAQFAENAAKAGWLSNYTIEYNDGTYSIVNNTNSTASMSTDSLGGKDIADQFMSDAGIYVWLNSRNIDVEYGDRTTDCVPAKYYHLTIDGHYFADNIQLIMNNDGCILECNFTIREYEKSDETVTLMPFVDALKDTFCVTKLNTPNSIEIYNAQLCFVAGIPVYALLGEPADGSAITAYTFAFEVNDSQYVTQLYEAIN